MRRAYRHFPPLATGVVAPRERNVAALEPATTDSLSRQRCGEGLGVGQPGYTLSNPPRGQGSSPRERNVAAIDVAGPLPLAPIVQTELTAPAHKAIRKLLERVSDHFIAHCFFSASISQYVC